VNYRYAFAFAIGVSLLGFILALTDAIRGRTILAPLGVMYVSIGAITGPIALVLRSQSDRIAALEKRLGAEAANEALACASGRAQTPPSA
jgi:hypothetical protein